MRKLTALLLTLALLCGLSLPAAAPALADRKIDAVALLVCVVNGDAAVTGSAVCVEDGEGVRWITAASALALGAPGYLMMEDSSYALIAETKPLGTGLLTELSLMGDLNAAHVPLSTRDRHDESESCIGYLSNAALLSTGAERIAAVTLPDGTPGLTCTSMDGLLPGTALFDEDGALCGLITAALTEGEGRYTGVDLPGLRAALNGEAAPVEKPEEKPDEKNDTTEAPKVPEGQKAPEGTTWIAEVPSRIEGTYLIVDFTGHAAVGQYIKIWCFDSGNEYFRWALLKPGEETEAYFPAVPGRSLVLYAAANPESEVGDRELTEAVQARLVEGTAVIVPEAGTEMPYGYRQECYLAVTPKDQAVGETERLPAAETVTREMLTDPDLVLWLQVNCSYTVTEDIEDSLLTCLFAPDGTVTTNMAGFIYGVDYMGQDDWHVDMTEEFRYMATLNGLPGGTYTLCYYVGDVLAGSWTFTLPGDTVVDGGDSV